MDEKQKALRAIRKNRLDCYKKPKQGMKKRQFDQLSYHNWAVEEIIKEIEASDTLSPISVVESFIVKMEDYACESKKNGWMFSVAKDAGEWVLDILISIK